jgi:hypothetical protein
MQRVLRTVGALPLHEVELAASSLYDKGFYTTQLYFISLFCVGERTNPVVSQNYPDVPQVIWTHVLTFIHERFRKYRRQKCPTLNGMLKAKHFGIVRKGTQMLRIFFVRCKL